MTRTVFESLAWLHAPADDPGSCALVEASRDWRMRVPLEAPAVVWGRMPARRQAFLGGIGSGLRRERALAAAADGRLGLRHWDTDRIPPIGRRPPVLGAVRFALMSGAVVRLGVGAARARVADGIAGEAGHHGPPVRLRVSGDGSVRAHVARAEDGPAILRLATVGGLKDAARNSDALRRLGEGGVASVPRLFASGTMLDVGWSTESELAGRPVERLSGEVLDQLVAWAATLPRVAGAPVAVSERLEQIGSAFPEMARDVRPAIERARAVAAAFAETSPAILEHGDLWTGNLLVEGGRLSGVVDWDNWHPAGVPGADLLHVIAMARRAETRQELGELWLERPWAGRPFREATAAYWSSLGLTLDDDLAWLVGVSWWSAHVAAGLRRGRQPASDPVWVARNVANVVPRLALGT